MHNDLTEEWTKVHSSLHDKEVFGLAKKEIYEQKTEALLMPVVEKHGFELVDVEYVKEGTGI